MKGERERDVWERKMLYERERGKRLENRRRPLCYDVVDCESEDEAGEARVD